VIPRPSPAEKTISDERNATAQVNPSPDAALVNSPADEHPIMSLGAQLAASAWSNAR